jgi:hypothetical protein
MTRLWLQVLLCFWSIHFVICSGGQKADLAAHKNSQNRNNDVQKRSLRRRNSSSSKKEKSSSSSHETPPLTREDICPVGREWSLPSKYYIQPMGDAFNEISYMAFSGQTYKDNPVAYVASDKKQSTLYAVYFHQNATTGAFQGSILGSFNLVTDTLMDTKRDTKRDWESIAFGPCGNNPSSLNCIYVGSTGNNEAHNCARPNCKEGRPSVEIFKFVEPDMNVFALNLGGSIEVPVQTISVTYRENFPSANNDGKHQTCICMTSTCNILLRFVMDLIECALLECSPS